MIAVSGEPTRVLQTSQEDEVSRVKPGHARLALGPDEQVGTTGGVVVQLWAALQVQIIEDVVKGVFLV